VTLCQRCADCGAVFNHSPEEVAARKGGGLSLSPRCPACREQRRLERNARRLEGYGGGVTVARPPAAPGPADGADELFPARCSECGRDVRLPFRPSTDRPAYCDSCFKARQGR
jgi:CxxC-x17-CxxC domain-containing protein